MFIKKHCWLDTGVDQSSAQSNHDFLLFMQVRPTHKLHVTCINQSEKKNMSHAKKLFLKQKKKCRKSLYSTTNHYNFKRTKKRRKNNAEWKYNM